MKNAEEYRFDLDIPCRLCGRPGGSSGLCQECRFSFRKKPRGMRQAYMLKGKQDSRRKME